MMFGSHLSIAGGMVNALHEAERLGMDTVQVFTKNQQQWKAKPLGDADVRAWTDELARLGWEGRAVSHASYLINLASPDDDLWRKSIDLMTDEIERCAALRIPFLVHHPGAHMQSGMAAGIARIADAYKELFRRTVGVGTVSCLEGTAGAGTQIGGRFEELRDLRAAIIDRTGHEARVGFCLDTCHMHAAGYDLSTRAQGEAVLDRFEGVCGLRHVRVMHVNDSKAKPGSRLDRHEHIGAGTIGKGPGRTSLRESGFAAVVRRPELRDRPMILETPKGNSSGGVAFDTLNLRRLRALLDDDHPPARRAKRPRTRKPDR